MEYKMANLNNEMHNYYDILKYLECKMEQQGR